MNALRVDQATGFLESPSPNGFTFTAEKKLRFLEVAESYRAQGKFPRVQDICKAIGINFSTFERHLQTDAKFQETWAEIASGIEYECIGDMHDLRKKNPMYMFGLLRYLNPKRWHPDSKQTIDLNIHHATALFDKAQAVEGQISAVNNALSEPAPALIPPPPPLSPSTHVLTELAPQKDAPNRDCP